MFGYDLTDEKEQRDQGCGDKLCFITSFFISLPGYPLFKTTGEANDRQEIIL